MAAALKAGRPASITPSGIAADSLGASAIGSLIYPIAKQHIHESVLVEDDDIRSAQRHLWASAQLVTEPGGAAAFAALLSGRYAPHGNERVGAVVCGANTSFDVFGKLFAMG
jgi:threonine dehydratase